MLQALIAALQAIVTSKVGKLIFIILGRWCHLMGLDEAGIVLDSKPHIFEVLVAGEY